MTLLRFLHILAILYLTAGVGNTVVPVWKAWRRSSVTEQAMLFSDAQRNESMFLLPGLIAVAVTGYAWAANEDISVIGTGWLLALQIVLGFNVFIFVPLMGIGLRRVHYLSLQSRKSGEVSEELESALADNVPLVFGTLIAASIPVMVWLPVFKPF